MNFSKELSILMMRNRQHLLMSRDPVANEKIAKKLERKIRKLKES